MKKIKIFLISLTIFVLAGTYFKTIAVAAEIAWINESKGRIHINGGVNAGLVPGGIVCFDISSAEKLTCGIVQSASSSKAVVKIEKRWAKKMKKGTQAMPLLYVEKKEKEEMKENISSRSMGIHDEVWFR